VLSGAPFLTVWRPWFLTELALFQLAGVAAIKSTFHGAEAVDLLSARHGCGPCRSTVSRSVLMRRERDG
jgi:hypothetical protein